MLIKGIGKNKIDAEIDGVRLCFFLDVKSSRRCRRFKLWAESGELAKLTKPSFAPMPEAEKFLLENWRWLGEALEKSSGEALSERLSRVPEICSEGKILKVVLLPSKAGAFFVEDLRNEKVVFSFSSEDSLQKCFSEYAREKLERLAGEVSKRTGIPVSKVRIGNQRGLWGSRSCRGTLSFNWRAVLLPAELQNYVVCHEFAHAKFMDHSVSFWIFLGRICDGARRLDKMLSKVGSEIFKVGKI